MKLPTPQLNRELGVWGATLMGLGSIIGTGIFVSLGIATDIAGPSVILAIVLGAIVAICNGLSAAQLAANHPVSGGTYEYGYHYLSPVLGFTAGWMFLIAKTASAATAALGFAGYGIRLWGWDPIWQIPIALLAVALLTALVLTGIRRSNRVNTVIVGVTLLALLSFVGAGLPQAIAMGTTHFTAFWPNSPTAVLQASALMFVAYTGYGRIATLGEEARSPRQTIPKAMIICLALTMVLYLLVASVAIGAVGSVALSDPIGQTQAAPLEAVARLIGGSQTALVVGIGAMTAMLGVLLNLVLGLSRVLLAMGRRFDMPRLLARLNSQQTTPDVAVWVVGLAIGLLVLTGNVKTTWSFSAFSVLIYYAITNAAALRLSRSQRLYPTWIAWVGLGSCLFLAFWVEPQVWLVGIALIVAGWIWHGVRQRIKVETD